MNQTQASPDYAIVKAEDFAELFLTDTPLLDVRAPVEFQRGAFPTASNIPLLEDDERQQVGLRYRQAGQDAAIKLGHELVTGSIRQQRLERWLQWLDEHPTGLLYCFRGGLRSQLVQQWLAEAGRDIPRIAGGYKALRRFLLDELERQAEKIDPIVVAGKTGCGKTHLLNQLSNSIDLEGRANHRGSAFGRRIEGQPGQIDFENHIAIDLLKQDRAGSAKLFIEDESHAIGSLSVPRTLFKVMKAAPLAVIEQPLNERVDIILNDYILANHRDFEARYGIAAFEFFAEYLQQALDRIQRRLGGDNYQAINKLLEQALEQQQQNGTTEGHRLWIEHLLEHYYDPMYDYQLGKKLDRLVFRGNAGEFLNWARQLNQEGRS